MRVAGQGGVPDEVLGSAWRGVVRSRRV